MPAPCDRINQDAATRASHDLRLQQGGLGMQRVAGDDQ
jgi:hypothetical protein